MSRLDLKSLNFGKEAAASERLELPSYFLTTEEYVRIERGDGWIIRGTKGSGKSAVVVKLSSLGLESPAFLDVSPSSVGWANLRENFGFKNLQIKKTAWLAAFLTEILALVEESGFEDYPLDVIQDLFKQSWMTTKSEWSLKEINASIKDFGIKLAKSQATPGKELEAVDFARFEYAVRNTLRLLDESLAADNIEIRLVVDGFDTLWNASDEDNESVAALFLAAQELFQQTSTVRALIFTRSDIWSRVKWDNKDHVKTDIVDLRWTPTSLKELIRRRIEHSLAHDFETADQAIEAVFESPVTGIQSYKKGMPAWDFITRLIPKRPRDLIMFCEIARRQRGDSSDRISGENLKKAADLYSEERLDNIVGAESAKTAPGLASSVDRLRKARHRIRWRSLKERLNSEDEKDAREQLNLLMEYGVCGIDRDGEEEYYEDNPQLVKADITGETYIVIHPGLRFALKTIGPYADLE